MMSIMEHDYILKMPRRSQTPQTMKTFEDLLGIVGTHGKINYILFVCACLGGAITGMHTFAYQFLGATPEHWCHVEELTKTNWTTEQIKSISMPTTVPDETPSSMKCEMYDLDYAALSKMDWNDTTDAALQMLQESDNSTVPCYIRDYGGDVETIVTKWDLVCERRALYSTTQAATQGGMLIGFGLIGWMMDKYGRLYVFRRGILFFIIFGFAALLSPTVEVFIFMRILTALAGTGFHLSGFVLSVELCSPKQRDSIGCYYPIPWALGMMLVAAIAYYVRFWITLQVVLIAPTLLLIPTFWILPESPRWLILNGYYDEAFKVLERIAFHNGRTLPQKMYVIDDMKQMQIDMRTEDGIDDDFGKTLWEKTKNNLSKAIVLITDKTFRMKTICVFISFFGVGFVYYGVSLGAPAVTDNNYLYLFIAGTLELPAYLILWPCVAYFGRKKSLVAFFFTSAVVIVSMMIIQLKEKNDEFLLLKLILSLGGKFAITPAYHLLWLFTAELFPTKYRSIAVGEANSVSRIGSIGSPYVNDLLGSSVAWGPAALFSTFALAAGIAVSALPETTNKILPDKVKKIQQIEGMS